jgi:predicted branched-subunit amino acid permease
MVFVPLTKTRSMEFVFPALFVRLAVARVLTLDDVVMAPEFVLAGSFATNHGLDSVNVLLSSVVI